MPLLVNTCMTVNIMIYSSKTNPDPNLYNYQNVDLRWNQSLFKVIQVIKNINYQAFIIFSLSLTRQCFCKMYFNLNSLTFASPMVCVSLLDTCDYILFTLIHLTPELLDLSEISTDPVNPIMVQPWKEQIYVSNSNLYQSEDKTTDRICNKVNMFWSL